MLNKLCSRNKLSVSRNDQSKSTKGTVPTMQLSRTLLLISAFVIPLGRASGQTYLTDITIFSADAAGDWVGPDIWTTRPNSTYDIWIQSGAPGGPFLNGPASATSQPDISLSPGVDTFTLLAEPGADYTQFGINLFFNGSLTPSISAYGTMLTAPGQAHVFAANNSLGTAAPIGPTTPGAGALSAVIGSKVVTLTDFFFATPSVYNLDMVGGYSTGPDGVNDYVGGITFSVMPVPEPQSSLWVLGLLATTIAVHRGTRRTQSRPVSQRVKSA